MVTTVTVVGNATANAIQEQFGSQFAGQIGGGNGAMLSDLAREALAGLNHMQAGYAGKSGAVPESGAQLIEAPAGVGEAAPATDYATMTREMTEAIQNSVRVQAQLGQFMMTASISTTMGSNLNTFLKGQ